MLVNLPQQGSLLVKAGMSHRRNPTYVAVAWGKSLSWGVRGSWVNAKQHTQWMRKAARLELMYGNVYTS
jgi:hypothetical protein